MCSGYGVCRKSERGAARAAQQAIVARTVRPRARCRAVRATLDLPGARISLIDDVSAVLHRVSYAAFIYECTYSKVKTSLKRVRFARSAAGTRASAAARNDPPGSRRDRGVRGARPRAPQRTPTREPRRRHPRYRLQGRHLSHR